MHGSYVISHLEHKYNIITQYSMTNIDIGSKLLTVKCFKYIGLMTDQRLIDRPDQTVENY